jgi:hypothetical protein
MFAPRGGFAYVGKISTSGKTLIGNATSGGGRAAGFDGVTSQASGSSPTGSNPMWLGVDWGAGNLVKVDQLKLWATNNVGAYNAGGSSITVTLYGSNSNPASATNGTALGTTSILDNNSATVDDNTGWDTTIGYRYTWITQNPGAGSSYLAEVEFWGSANF